MSGSVFVTIFCTVPIIPYEDESDTHLRPLHVGDPHENIELKRPAQ